MNDYEARRQARIKHNQALLSQLDIRPLVNVKPGTTAAAAARQRQQKPARKKRRLDDDDDASTSRKRALGPTRSSARIAASASRTKSYAEEQEERPFALSRSKYHATAGRRTRRSGSSNGVHTHTSPKSKDDDDNDNGSPEPEPEPEPEAAEESIASIIAGWTSWAPVGPAPVRDPDTGVYRFADAPGFEPNESPEQVLREGAFGGGYFRLVRSRKLGIVVQDDWKSLLPHEWIAGLSVERYLTSPVYDASVNKYGVACGQSIEEWEASGWISHQHDVRGWFQWYIRFWLGRRCDDDPRQISRWAKCVGPSGRWRRALLKKYAVLGLREVFDHGENDDDDDNDGRGPATSLSPAVHQTCHHWAFELRQHHLDEMWAEIGSR